MRKYLIILSIFLCIGCAPKKFKPFQPPELNFNATEEYSINLDKIKKPEKIQPVYVDQEFNKTTVDKASYVVLTETEFSKVGDLVQLAGSYKKIILEQEDLVNIHIEKQNQLKELLEMERKKALSYRELWVNAENAYRQERFLHKQDNMINRTGLYLVSIGSIGLLLLGL